MTRARRIVGALALSVGLVVAGVVCERLARAMVMDPVPLTTEARGTSSVALGRCRREGEGASADPDCRRVWAQARAAFLRPTPERVP